MHGQFPQCSFTASKTADLDTLLKALAWSTVSRAAWSTVSRAAWSTVSRAAVSPLPYRFVVTHYILTKAYTGDTDYAYLCAIGLIGVPDLIACHSYVWDVHV